MENIARVATATAPQREKINVLVVDDSLVIRGTIARILGSSPEIAVAGTVQNGKAALDRVAKGGVDVVVLDIEMPIMDGLTALPRLLAADPGLIVIMASTLTTRNAEVSLEALKLGAADYVPKPSSASEIYSTADFRRDLLEKVLTLGARRLRKRAPASVTAPQHQLTAASPSRQRPRVLAVGSSTGGPNALAAVLGSLPRPLGVPVAVTQHMPPGFTAILAKHLARETGWDVKEAESGDAFLPDRILVAPGDRHLLIEGVGSQAKAILDTGPKENFCRPAVDPMLRSLTKAYGAGVLAVVLTGMGQDGLLGARGVVEAGGAVIAQDEPTSVVWGMPGAIAKAGLASAVLPLRAIGGQIAALVKGKQS